MALELRTHIMIKASPTKVWEILMDFETYGEWNPFVLSIKGIAGVGEKLNIHIGGMKFRPKVLSLDPNQKFVWLGHLFLPGLFDGKHSFELEEQADGSTHLIHSESFTGILVPVFKNQLLGQTKAGFEAMNEALKARVEEII
ncbi:MAG: SRPBCC domain-containing protein [Bacteroidota bacterium]